MELQWDQAPAIIAQIAMGLGLAASAGLRTFLPLLLVGAAGRFDIIPLMDRFEWLSSWPALTVFAVAVVLELAGDKFAVVDNILDVVQTFSKPVAGTVLMAGVVTDLSPLQNAVIAIVLGGTVAGGVHVAKSKLRLLSTATTFGVGNPLLSVTEDALAFSGSIAAILLPLVFLALFLVLAIIAGFYLRKRASRASSSMGTLPT